MTVARLNDRFAELKREGRAGFVAYVMAGDPDPETSARIARRGFCLAALLLALAGCGFHPLYAAGGGVRDWDPALAAISVRPIPDRPGQILALALRENLNPSGVSAPKRWDLLRRALAPCRAVGGPGRSAARALDGEA